MFIDLDKTKGGVTKNNWSRFIEKKVAHTMAVFVFLVVDG
jgi:hypothetical protein